MSCSGLFPQIHTGAHRWETRASTFNLKYSPLFSSPALLFVFQRSDLVPGTYNDDAAAMKDPRNADMSHG